MMLMKGHLSLKSLAAVTVLTACLPGPSLAAAKWARCTPYSKEEAVTKVYDVELKTDSEKLSLIRDVRVDNSKLPDNFYTESSNSQIIAPARWFATEIVIGPFKSNTYTATVSSGETITRSSNDSLKISRQDLSYEWGPVLLGKVYWSENFGSCKIIPSPVKTLF